MCGLCTGRSLEQRSAGLIDGSVGCSNGRRHLTSSALFTVRKLVLPSMRKSGIAVCVYVQSPRVRA
uniref:Uncharacterized protein n=1 Tax=Anopheles quadriannulatus TaxID=34691 RepID=A0A182XRM3_ANOQN